MLDLLASISSNVFNYLQITLSLIQPYGGWKLIEYVWKSVRTIVFGSLKPVLMRSSPYAQARERSIISTCASWCSGRTFHALSVVIYFKWDTFQSNWCNFCKRNIRISVIIMQKSSQHWKRKSIRMESLLKKKAAIKSVSNEIKLILYLRSRLKDNSHDAYVLPELWKISGFCNQISEGRITCTADKTDFFASKMKTYTNLKPRRPRQSNGVTKQRMMQI